MTGNENSPEDMGKLRGRLRPHPRAGDSIV